MSHPRRFLPHTLLTALLIALAPISASAQMATAAEIEQAVAAMRASGAPEAQIQQFIENMQQFNSPGQPAAQSSSSHADDIQTVTGMSDKEIALVGPMADAIMANQEKETDQALERKVSDFEKRFSDKPDITAEFDGNTIALKRIDCESGDAFRVSAQAAPTVSSRPGIVIGAQRGWSVREGKWIATIGVQDGGDNYRADLPDTAIGVKGVRYDGVVISDNGAVKPLRFNANCADQ